MSIAKILRNKFPSFARSLRKKERIGCRSLRFRPISLELLEERQLLAVFAVNSTMDTEDANPGDGLAEDDAGNATLRAPVMVANATVRSDSSDVPSGTCNLALTGFGKDESAPITSSLASTPFLGR